MKILYVSTVAGTMKFFPAHINMLQRDGNEIEIACNVIDGVPAFCNKLGLKVHHIPFSRSPVSKQNIQAFKQLKKLVYDGNYDIIHTHTPNASAIVRLACRKLRKNGTKVFYTAHGFHFYKGAPIKNWLFFYPVEWLCAHWTDKLITINREDYALARKHMHAKEVIYVPGVGIDLEKFGGEILDSIKKRESLDIPEDKIWVLSVGELITRKNHETLIRAVANISSIYLTIAGNGELENYLSQLIDDLELKDRVKLLGYRSDISELCEAADIFCLPSFQEGLPVSLMEAMSCGRPCVVSKIRGNTDLISDSNLLFDPYSVEDIARSLVWTLNSDMKQIGSNNKNKVREFDIKDVLEEMKFIYHEYSRGGGDIE